jgi:ATP-binding cassette subfamily B protein
MTERQIVPGRTIYRRLLAYLRPYWPQVSTAYVALLGATLLNLYVPQVVKQAIDSGLTAGHATTLFAAGGAILGLALLRGGMAFFRRYFGEWLSYRVAYDLRNEFYDSVQRLPFEFHDRTQTGDLMSRATSDVSETEAFVGIGLMQLVTAVLMMVGVVVAMLLENLPVAAVTLIPMPLLLYMTLRFGNRVRPIFRTIQDQMGTLSTVMQESLTGVMVVKAFAREPHELAKFDRENEKWFDLRKELVRAWGNNWSLFSFLLSACILLLLLFGGPRALAGQITVGSLFALASYILMLNGPIQDLGFLVNQAATAVASASRVFEIVDTPSTVVEGPAALALERVQGQVAFDGVSFGYRKGLNVLRDISFTAEPGQVVALVGPTGSGKSTIINLIPRFYDPSDGRVLVDDHDVRDVTLASLRRHIGIVLQDPFLFRSTIAENIAYGRPEAGIDEIIAVAQAAHAHDFILEFPDGYETRVGERGVTLSGGQRQRIAIARALLYNPRILILDDSTSSVDTETEHLIQLALRRLMEGRTTFVIAQRLLTLKSADVILVLDHGEIVERGTHAELLTRAGLYRQIYDLQLRDQEESR